MATKTRTRKISRMMRPVVLRNLREAVLEDPNSACGVSAIVDLIAAGQDVADLPKYDPTKPIVCHGPQDPTTKQRPVEETYKPGTVPAWMGLSKAQAQALGVQIVGDAEAVLTAAEPTKASSGDTRTSRKQPAATDVQVGFIASLLADKDITAIAGGANIPQVQLGQYEAGTLTKRGASELIDWLKDRPAKAVAQGGRPATEKQVAALVREGKRRELTGLSKEAAATTAKAIAGTAVGFAEASAALDELFSSPFAKRSRVRETARNQAAEEGMYARTENGQRVFYKVQIAHHGSGRPYAKRLVAEDGEWHWERARGVVNELTEGDRMSLEEAQAFGKLYGVCCQCATVLTDEKSIAAGIGPVCAGKF